MIEVQQFAGERAQQQGCELCSRVAMKLNDNTADDENPGLHRAGAEVVVAPGLAQRPPSASQHCTEP